VKWVEIVGETGDVDDAGVGAGWVGIDVDLG
jgi:hypothetical protein